MRIIKYTSILTAFLTSHLALAQTKSEISFTPGSYVLVKASGRDNAAELCGGDSIFKYSDNGKNILLGAKHGFSLINSLVKTEALDDPEEKGCVYENSKTFSVGKEITYLSSKELLKCAGDTKHMFIETASISINRVHLEFKQFKNERQQNKPDVEYKCTWELKERSAASVKKKK